MIFNLAIYQIIIIFISFMLICRTFVLFIKNIKTLRELLLSIFIWGGFGSLGLFPNLSDYLAKVTGFELGINVLLVLSILILLYYNFAQIIKNEKLESQITKIVRYEALKDLEKYEDDTK